ncbi:acyl-CoA dehydrogenase family protein [Actinomadura atramentaria]|uniref:acyl-CoA dehydrogenase family protein n=1 Tax=Actinomadura atramentaria TaxID=1990 RepID=UPI00035E6374|nr:acyl-CoA dehydrogenase family protein [Actinomadura atramentaria]
MGGSDERDELRRVLRRFFAERSPVAEVRRLTADGLGHDPAVWAALAGTVGVQGLAVAEEFGGAGCGMRELVVALEEAGRALACAPLLATAVAAEAVAASGDAALAAEALPPIADGSLIATLAWAEGDRWDVGTTTARRDGDGWVLDGVKDHVLDGCTAGLVLVAARDEHGEPDLFAVRADAATRTPLPCLDRTRRLARLEFAGTPARRVANGPAALARALDAAAVLLAAEQLGGAQRAFDMTVEYVKVRRQFGRPIGSFQAVKHRCADLYVLVESARSAVLGAAAAADGDPAALPAAAATAQAYCADAFFQVAAETIQLHGGIGFTWEHDAHLYFKRAAVSRELFGPPARHRARLAALVGLTA